MNLTQEQLQILQHALGLDEHGQGKMYRNHFCAGVADEDICRSLVAMGYMETFTRSYLPYYNCTVTEAVRRESPPPPKLTRGQRRYRDYLKADTGRSFIEWLRDRRDFFALGEHRAQSPHDVDAVEAQTLQGGGE